MNIEDEILEELQDKERLIAGQEKLINEKNRSLAEKDNTIVERDNALAEKDNTIVEKNKALAEKEKQMVINMGRAGSEISFISQIIGLSIDEIMRILEENVE